LRKVLSFKAEGQRKWRQPQKTWRKQVEEQARGTGLQKEDTGTRWRNAAKLITPEKNVYSVTGIEPDQS